MHSSRWRSRRIPRHVCLHKTYWLLRLLLFGRAMRSMCLLHSECWLRRLFPPPVGGRIVSEIITMAKKAADAWRNTDTYHQAAQIIDMLVEELERKPTLTPPEIVYCQDCVHHEDGHAHWCNKWEHTCPDDSEFFCKYGRKKDGKDRSI